MPRFEPDLSIFPPGDHPADWDAPLMTPSLDIAAWLVGLMADDIAAWSPGQELSVQAELRIGFAHFLADHLPTDVPRPALTPPRARVKVI